jgi:hypothetical protein
LGAEIFLRQKKQFLKNVILFLRGIMPAVQNGILGKGGAHETTVFNISSAFGDVVHRVGRQGEDAGRKTAELAGGIHGKVV